MAIKNLIKTRWKTEPDRITVYPYGLFYILGVALAVLFAGVFLAYMHYQNTSIAESLPFLWLFIVMAVLFWGFASTSVEFDNHRGVMRKKLMGFLPVSIVPFNKLHGINAVTNLGGGYNYRMFKKDDRYGKGTVVSAGYGKNDDPNAIAFVNEAVPVIHGFLDQHAPLDNAVAQPITTYKYFISQGGKYTIKKNKVGSIILGVCLVGLGIHELTPAAWLAYDGGFGKIFMLLFLLVGGAALILAGFTNITFDTGSRTVQRTSPIGLGNKTYSFDYFTGIQTVRRTVNLIYVGTDVMMYFAVPGKTKQEGMALNSFKRSKNIERFVQEVYSILESAHK